MSARSISIVLCNYNDARFLPDSLGAICQQSVPPDELLIVDDGSTDDSLEVISEYSRNFSFIRVLRNEENRGLMYSINLALQQARMDCIVWAAADDILLPNFLARNHACMDEFPQARITCSRLATFVDGTDVRTQYDESSHGAAFDFTSKPHFLDPVALRARLRQSYLWISGNAVVAQRDVLLAAGGIDERLEWHADWYAFYAAALRHGVCLIPETLALMRVRENTYSSSGANDQERQVKVLSELANILAEPRNDDIRPIFVECPSLLSPFGMPMFDALMRKPRDWRLAGQYAVWWARYLIRHKLDEAHAGGHSSRFRIWGRFARSVLLSVSSRMFSVAFRERIKGLLRLG